MMQAEPALYGDQPPPTGNYLLATTDPFGVAETPIFGNDQVSRYDEFWDLRKKIYDRAKLYGKPVIIAHGDQHTYTLTPNYLTMNQSKKGADVATGAALATGLADLPALANVTRLENFGSNGATTSGTKNWTEVKATCGTDYVFSQRARAVGTAPGAFVDFASTTPSPTVPEARFPVLLVLGPVALGGVALLRRRRTAVS